MSKGGGGVAIPDSTFIWSPVVPDIVLGDGKGVCWQNKNAKKICAYCPTGLRDASLHLCIPVLFQRD